MLLIICRRAGVLVRNTLRPSVLGLTECHSALTPNCPPSGCRVYVPIIPCPLWLWLLDWHRGRLYSFVHRGVDSRRIAVLGGRTVAIRSSSVAETQVTITSSEATGMFFIARIERIISMNKFKHSCILHNGIRGDLAVKLAFKTKDIRTLCESQVRAERAFGIEVARRLRGLLADLDTAETLQEIPVEELRESEGSGPDDYEAPLVDGYVVQMRVNHLGLARSAAGRIDRSMVRRLKILDIEKFEVTCG